MSSNHRKYISLIPHNRKRSDECVRQGNSFRTVSQSYSHNMAIKRDQLKYNSVNISNDSNNNIRNNISKSFFYEKLFRSTSHIKKHLHQIHQNLYNDDSDVKDESIVSNSRKQNKNSFRVNAKTSKNFKDAFGINAINNSKALEMFVNQIHTNSNKRIFQYNKVINSINQQLLCKKCSIKPQDNNVNNDDEGNLDKTAFSSNALSKNNSSKNIKQQAIPRKSMKLTRSHSFVDSTSSRRNNLKAKAKIHKCTHNKKNNLNVKSCGGKGTSNHVETCSVFGLVDEKNNNEKEFPLGEDKFEKVNSSIDIKKGLLNKMNRLVVKNSKGKNTYMSSNININTASTGVNGVSTYVKRGRSTDKGLVFDEESKGNDVNKNKWGCNMFSNAFKCG